MYSPDHIAQALVGKSAQEAWRRRDSGTLAQSLDEKHLQQALQDDIPPWALHPPFFPQQMNQGRQPLIATDVDELRQQRSQQASWSRTESR